MRVFCKRCEFEMAPIWNPDMPREAKRFIGMILETGTHKGCGGFWRVDIEGNEYSYDWDGNPKAKELRNNIFAHFDKKPAD
ncbi:MAG: hypothetical protein A2172_05400 [Candidatus Woykebacteria bacterium RBG_13_40_15]|uniref:Uncharacterized protein n=1 Tax=Candidatus Woykebacteria bacterium RBG_13_40_15 TaxID=1802593 RepID=A0A1G1W8F1_9BACT|nr:MAG: hypothetical protein A2172_05400 [Candidatus Woykebacteria bacterium RBG_13_40_15]